MSKFSSIASITCWYGEYPWYFPYFLHSCSFNPSVDFYIITDNQIQIDHKPDNVKIIYKKFTCLNILMLLFVQICFSQNNEINQLLINGEKAFLENNFLLAKEIYTKSVDVYPKNKDFWFNLGTTELKLEESDNACEHFYQAYLLNDGEAVKIIKENCPNFRNGSIMSLNDVEEKPKFIYGRKEYLLTIDNSLNPKYISVLMSRVKFSTIMSKYKGRIFVQFQINKSGTLDTKIVSVSGDQKEAEIIKKEILSILNNLFTYIPAKNKGVNVDLWDKCSLILNFLMEPYK